MSAPTARPRDGVAEEPDRLVELDREDPAWLDLVAAAPQAAEQSGLRVRLGRTADEMEAFYRHPALAAARLPGDRHAALPVRRMRRTKP